MMRTSSRLRCATILGLVGLSVGMSGFGCSAPDTQGNEARENIGSLGLTLLAGGVTLNGIDYTITGPAGYTKAGRIDVSGSTQISAVIGGIPAGIGYTVSLSASDAGNPATTCAGSASFNVTAGATTSAQVHLLCKAPPKNGSVTINGTLNVCPNVDALSVEPADTSVGHAITLTASGSDVDQAPSALSFTWTSTGGTLSGADTANATLTCTVAGQITVTLVVSDGDCRDTASQVVNCSNATGGDGSGGSGSSGAGGVGGGGTTSGAGSGGVAGAAAGGAAGSGAGGAGGTANSPGGGAGSAGLQTAFATWPGRNSVVTVDVANTWPSNLSGLFYEPTLGAVPPVLWAVQNGPSKLFRLLFNGTSWVSDSDNGWSAGKSESYAGGTGAPDSEGITKAAFGTSGLYVSTERDNNNNAVSRLSVLLFDGSIIDSTLTATRDWNLTADLPVAGANLGLEAITWVPDSYLMSKGFIDESSGRAYDPTMYANHAGGIFFVGLEQNGMIYGYALDHVGGGFTRVATVYSGNPSIMDLSFDRDVGYLWAAGDDSLQGRTNVLDVDTRAGSATRGKFYVRQGFERPSTMPNTNNEGFTVTPESSCVDGFKPVFYSDDNDLNGHSIRRDAVPCGAFL